jgi:membrane associated rhomboid family serine protease
MTDRHAYVFLLRAERPDQSAAVRELLDEAEVPYLTAGESPGLCFSVPADQVDLARSMIADCLGPNLERVGADRFPWRPIQTVAALVLLHFALVFYMIGVGGREMVVAGALLKGRMLDEPWRLFTALFLHSGPTHAFWNGAATLVFAVPLLTDRGYLPTALIYLASGVGGGIAALYYAAGGTLILGSSGAVAGLFGAWLVLRLRRDRWAPLGWRARIRTAGVALLVLPSLLNPVTASGQPVSVSSHLGGLATGTLIGAVLSSGLLRLRRMPDLPS